MLPLTVPAILRSRDARRATDGSVEAARSDGEDVFVESGDGTRLHLFVTGSGPRTVFFVHGWTCNETIFNYQQQTFGADYRIVCPELRGHGRSDIPSNLDYHPELLAADIKAAVDFFGPDEFVIAGHSLGGFSAFKFYELFADEYEGRLKGLAIIDSTGTDLLEGLVFGDVVSKFWPVPVNALLEFLGRHNRISGAVKGAIKETSLAYMIVRWGAFGREPIGDHVEHVREMVLSTPMTSMMLAAKACLDYHYEYYLPSVDLPVLMIVGDRDKLTDLPCNERTVALLPQARLKVFQGAGHCTQLERREEFDRELASFLEEVFRA